jgi:hypothetical protein
MLDAAGRTPANSVLQFRHVCDTLLGLTPGNVLLSALEHQGWESTMDLVAITDANINTMVYEDAAGVALIVSPGCRSKLCIVCSMLAHWTHEKKGPIDVTSITPDDFSTWRLYGYNPRAEIRPDPTAPAILPGARAAAGGTPTEQFQRGIKKDKDHYPEFKDKKYWDTFRRQVETVAYTHGLQDVLNPNFIPAVGDAEAHALF